MKKKMIALIMCVLMVGSLVLSGCGSSSGSSSDDATFTLSDGTEVTLDGSWPEETILIGVEIYDTTDEQTLNFLAYLDYLTDYFNIEFMVSESLDSAEGELDFIDSCAAAGCEALIAYYNVSGTAAIQEAIDLGMYYWGTEDYGQEFLDNEYYVGYYTLTDDDSSENGDYLAGYELAYSIAEAGCTHVFYCNGGASFGVQMFIDRQEGFEAGIAAAQADGYDIEYDSSSDVIEGWPGTDDFSAAVTAKLDGSYDGAVIPFGPSSIIQPVIDAGLSGSMKLAALCTVTDTYVDIVTDGTLTTVVYECEEIMFGNSVVQVLNAVTGHVDATRDSDGNAGGIHVNRWVLDADSYSSIYAYHEDGNYFVSAADVASMLVEFNSEITFDEINDFYYALDLETGLSMIE